MRETEMNAVVEKIAGLKERFERAKLEKESVNQKEELLGWDASEFEILLEGVAKLEPYEKLWTLASEFTKAHHQWMRGPLFPLEPEKVDQEANGMWRAAFRLQGQFGEDLPEPCSVAVAIKSQLDTFKQRLPLLHALCSPGLRPRHWEEISSIVGFLMEPETTHTLARIIDMELTKFLPQLQEISDSAAKEYSIEKLLDSMLKEWQPLEMETKDWKDTGTCILAGQSLEDIQTLLDDHVVKTQTMKGSPFAKPFESPINDWERWLIATQEILTVWLKVQSQWLYLEPIFSLEDIMKQMPTGG